MKKEIEFVKSMTQKLKMQGDISESEATRIFILTTVIHAYDNDMSEKSVKCPLKVSECRKN